MNIIIIAVVTSILVALFIGVIVFVIYRVYRVRKRREAKKWEEPGSSLTSSVAMSRLYSNVTSQGAKGNVEYDAELVFVIKISAGSFGEVWKGKYNGEYVAIKKIKLDRMPKDQLAFIRNVVDEATIMKEMKHERVVPFIGFDIKTFSIIMELMPRGSLSSFIKENKKTCRWSTRYQMMLDICEGMAFLHSGEYPDGSIKQVLYHQDLKTANVMLVAEGGMIRSKIGDFGLSCMLQFF
jgi:hypothetical protein